MELLTIIEAAKFLKVSRQTIYKWIRDEKLFPIELEGIRRFDKKDLEHFVVSRKNNVGNPTPVVA